jgi:hypothetical protein
METKNEVINIENLVSQISHGSESASYNTAAKLDTRILLK